MHMLMFGYFMVMAVIFAVAIVSVRMSVDMLVFVSMNRISVGVLMSMYMLMLVSMLQNNGVFHHNNRADHHDHKSNIKL